MIVLQKKPFYRGIFLLLAFFAIFYFLLTPFITVDGEKLTGLQYSDQIFNELSKDSSNFLSMAAQAATSMTDKIVDVDAKLAPDAPENLQTRLLTNAGATAINFSQNRVRCKVDLGTLLRQAVTDSTMLYNNEEDRLFAKYSGINPLDIAKAWWLLLTPIAWQMQAQNHVQEANAINVVIRRALEPGNNYYGIPTLKIADNIPLIAGFLLFYILYTVWYGFSIYEIFTGLGLMASHAEEEISEE